MKKKIIFINGHMNTGGVERTLLDILRNMDYKNYSVDLFLVEDLGDYINYIPPQVNIIFKDFKDTYGSFFSSLKTCIIKRNYFCLKARLIILLKKMIGLRAYFLFKYILPFKNEYDVLISFRHGFCADLSAFAIKAKKKIVWWHHGEINFSNDIKKDIEITFSKFNNIISVSEPFSKMLKECFPNMKNRISTIPNMIDKNRIIDLSDEYIPFEKQHKIILVSVGRISKEKHFENVIFASKQLLEKGIENFKWYIVGGDWDFEIIKQLIVDCNLEKYIIMVGKKKNPYPYLINANMYVHTSYVESQGLTILEAMSLGCPCVVTESIGVKTFVNDGVNAILVQQNVDSLVQGILKLYNNNFLKKVLIDNAFDTVNQYAPEIIMKKIYKLFD